MIDCFSPTFPGFLLKQKVQNRENFNFFTCWIYIISEFTTVFIGYSNIVCTLLSTGNYDWSISLVVKCKIKSCLATYAISVTLPLSSCARSVTSLMLYDVNK